MKVFPAAAWLAIAGLAVWLAWPVGRAEEPRSAAAVFSRRDSAAGRVEMSYHRGRRSFPLPPAGDDAPGVTEPALKAKVEALVKRRAETPGALARARALEKGFRAVMEPNRVALKYLTEESAQLEIKSRQPASPEERKITDRHTEMITARKGLIQEMWDEY